MSSTTETAVVLAAFGAVWVGIIGVFAFALCRAAGKEPPRHAAPGQDPVDAELAGILADADRDAVLNATRCDCPRCQARRRRAERP